MEGPIRLDFGHFACVPESELKPSGFVDPEAIAAFAVLVPAAEQRLGMARLRAIGAYKRDKRKASVEDELCARIGDLKVRPHLGELLLDPPGAVRLALDTLLYEARSGGVLIAMNETHQLCVGRSGAVGCDVKLNSISGLQRDLVRVSKNFGKRHLTTPTVSGRAEGKGRERPLPRKDRPYRRRRAAVRRGGPKARQCNRP